MSKNLALLLLATLGVAACSGHLGVAPPQKLDLSGHWALNGKLSDDPGKVVHEQERRGRERRDRDRDRMAGDMENPPLPGPESRPEPPTSSARTAYRRLWEKAQEERIAMLDSGSRLEITPPSPGSQRPANESRNRCRYQLSADSASGDP